MANQHPTPGVFQQNTVYTPDASYYMPQGFQTVYAGRSAEQLAGPPLYTSTSSGQYPPTSPPATTSVNNNQHVSAWPSVVQQQQQSSTRDPRPQLANCRTPMRPNHPQQYANGRQPSHQQAPSVGEQQPTHSGYHRQRNMPTQQEVNNTNSANDPDGRVQEDFVFMLMAPTSAAVPMNQESVTYLNQHQSYEIQCRKQGREYDSMLYKTIVSICFHNKRQQFEEDQLMEGWRKAHAQYKPIDIDIPLSTHVIRPVVGDSCVEFYWDPRFTTSVFIKIALLSTDFTAKKQGGEKGIPFRLMVQTFETNQLTGFNNISSTGLNDTIAGANTKSAATITSIKAVYTALAQIRMFKLKGADRRNKTDRERAARHIERALHLQEQFQPAYDYTIFTLLNEETDQPLLASTVQLTDKEKAQTLAVEKPSNESTNRASREKDTLSSGDDGSDDDDDDDDDTEEQSNERQSTVSDTIQGSPTTANEANSQRRSNQTLMVENQSLLPTSDHDTTQNWLSSNNFGHLLNTFKNFKAVDLLRLSRGDLISLCHSPADGIRLYNGIRQKSIEPFLTLFVRPSSHQSTEESHAPADNSNSLITHTAVFLYSYSTSDLMVQLRKLLEIADSQEISRLLIVGPYDIRVLVTDELLGHWKDRTVFTANLVTEPGCDNPAILLTEDNAL